MSTKLLKSAATPEEEWPNLIPLNHPNLPRLNLKHIPSWAGAYAKALSDDTETPSELAAGMVLITCATAVARRFQVMVKPGYSEPCNLWAVVALAPGNRKSAVQSGTTVPLMSWEHDQSKLMDLEIKHVESERKTMEARAKELRNMAAKEKDRSKAETYAREAADLEAELPKVPVSPQLWTSDATPERLGSLLTEHDECMAWLSSEGGLFDTLQGRYSNGIPNLDLMLKSHSGDTERVDRGGRQAVFLRQPRLSIGLTPQPEVLRGLASKKGFRGRGLLGRFLYLMPVSPLGYRKFISNPVPKSVLEDYTAGVHSMLQWVPATDENGEEQLHILKLSDKAYFEHLEFSKNIEAKMRPNGEMEHCTDWAGKAPGAAARIAGILHCIKYAQDRPWETLISEETMMDALEIMAVITHHSIAALEMMSSDSTINAASNVWSWIERNKQPNITIRDIFNALRGTYPKIQNIKDALSELEDRGYVKIIKIRNDGPGRRPSPIVKVRP